MIYDKMKWYGWCFPAPLSRGYMRSLQYDASEVDLHYCTKYTSTSCIPSLLHVIHNLWCVWKGLVDASCLLRQVVAWEGLKTTVHNCASKVDTLTVQTIQVPVAYQAYSGIIHNNYLWCAWKGLVDASWLPRQGATWKVSNTTVQIVASNVDYP